MKQFLKLSLVVVLSFFTYIVAFADNIPQYDQNTDYYYGQKVMYKGNEYTCIETGKYGTGTWSFPDQMTNEWLISPILCIYSKGALGSSASLTFPSDGNNPSVQLAIQLQLMTDTSTTYSGYSYQYAATNSSAFNNYLSALKNVQSTEMSYQYVLTINSMPQDQPEKYNQTVNVNTSDGVVNVFLTDTPPTPHIPQTYLYLNAPIGSSGDFISSGYDAPATYTDVTSTHENPNYKYSYLVNINRNSGSLLPSTSKLNGLISYGVNYSGEKNEVMLSLTYGQLTLSNDSNGDQNIFLTPSSPFYLDSKYEINTDSVSINFPTLSTSDNLSITSVPSDNNSYPYRYQINSLTTDVGPLTSSLLSESYINFQYKNVSSMYNNQVLSISTKNPQDILINTPNNLSTQRDFAFYINGNDSSNCMNILSNPATAQNGTFKNVKTFIIQMAEPYLADLDYTNTANITYSNTGIGLLNNYSVGQIRAAFLNLRKQGINVLIGFGGSDKQGNPISNGWDQWETGNQLPLCAAQIANELGANGIDLDCEPGPNFLEQYLDSNGNADISQIIVNASLAMSSVYNGGSFILAVDAAGSSDGTSWGYGFNSRSIAKAFNKGAQINVVNILSYNMNQGQPCYDVYHNAAPYASLNFGIDANNNIYDTQKTTAGQLNVILSAVSSNNSTPPAGIMVWSNSINPNDSSEMNLVSYMNTINKDGLYQK